MIQRITAQVCPLRYLEGMFKFSKSLKLDVCTVRVDRSQSSPIGVL